MEDFQGKIEAIDMEFKEFLSSLTFKKSVGPEQNLTTFSPLDAVADFEFKGLQSIAEVSHSAMLDNNDGMRRLLANMMSQCRPGSLNDEDMEHLSGINGREMSL